MMKYAERSLGEARRVQEVKVNTLGGHGSFPDVQGDIAVTGVNMWKCGDELDAL